MRYPRFLVSSSLIISLFVASESFAADTSERTAAPSFASQSDATGISRLPARQPDASTTLEIAPQPSTEENPLARSEVPAGRVFRKAEDIAALNRNFHPLNSDHAHNPYLGISVEYSTHCYLGMEEHGFEVMTVYPGSPAARAGLQARTPSTPMGDLRPRVANPPALARPFHAPVGRPWTIVALMLLLAVAAFSGWLTLGAEGHSQS